MRRTGVAIFATPIPLFFVSFFVSFFLFSFKSEISNLKFPVFFRPLALRRHPAGPAFSPSALSAKEKACTRAESH
jgi:hypothetical protein